MITEVRARDTNEMLWEGVLPEATVTFLGKDVHICWMGVCGSRNYITVTERAKVTYTTCCLNIMELPPEPKLPDELVPIKNYLHRDWEIKGDGIFADGWTIARVRAGIWTDGIGNNEMFRGNKSLIKNAPRTYEAMIALYNSIMENLEDFEPDEIEALQEVANLANEIKGECE